MNLIYYNLIFWKNKSKTHISDETMLKNNSGCVISVFHYGVYQIIPYILSKFTKKDIIIYANEEMSKSVLKVIMTLEGEIPKNLIVLSLDYKSVFKAVRSVKNGAILLIMPEIDLGNTQKDEKNKATINFMGKNLVVPSGPVKIAEMTKSDIYSLYIDEKIDSLNLNFKKINTRNNLNDSIKELWKNLEETVAENPHKWSIWERMDDLYYEIPK